MTARERRFPFPFRWEKSEHEEVVRRLYGPRVEDRCARASNPNAAHVMGLQQPTWSDDTSSAAVEQGRNIDTNVLVDTLDQ